jgi:uncharacterized protein (TIGR03435 family)
MCSAITAQRRCLGSGCLFEAGSNPRSSGADETNVIRDGARPGKLCRNGAGTIAANRESNFLVRTVRVALIAFQAALMCAVPVRAQVSAPAYDVVSVKPNHTGGRPQMGSGAGGTLTATNVNLKLLIELAYNVRAYQISGGPSWLESVGYDIVATVEHPVNPNAANRDYFRQLLQNLVADRFKLKVKVETKELPVYALIVGKDGSKLKGGEKPENATDMRMRGGPGLMIGQKLTIQVLSEALSEVLGRPVVGKTGLPGYYDFKLEWTPDDSDTPGASIFTAIQEQLGLKLESQKGPVEVVVIQAAERASEN